jgi:hypothetical protein
MQAKQNTTRLRGRKPTSTEVASDTLQKDTRQQCTLQKDTRQQCTRLAPTKEPRLFPSALMYAPAGKTGLPTALGCVVLALQYSRSDWKCVLLVGTTLCLMCLPDTHNTTKQCQCHLTRTHSNCQTRRTWRPATTLAQLAKPPSQPHNKAHVDRETIQAALKQYHLFHLHNTRFLVCKTHAKPGEQEGWKVATTTVTRLHPQHASRLTTQ